MIPNWLIFSPWHVNAKDYVDYFVLHDLLKSYVSFFPAEDNVQQHFSQECILKNPQGTNTLKQNQSWGTSKIL